MAKEKPQTPIILAQDVPIGFGLTAQHLLLAQQVLTIIEEQMAVQPQSKEMPTPKAHETVSTLMDVFERVTKDATFHKIRNEGDSNEPS